MPRQIRGKEQPRAPMVSAPQVTTPAEYVPWKTNERSRSHCPFCGMMTDTARFDSGPYWFDMYIQRWGGSYPGYKQKGDRIVRNGYIEYEDDSRDSDNMIRQLIPYSKQVTQSLLARLGKSEPIQDHVAGKTPNEYQEFDELEEQRYPLPEFETDFIEHQLEPTRVPKEVQQIERPKRRGRPLRSAQTAPQLPQRKQHSVRQIQPAQSTQQRLSPSQRRRQLRAGNPQLPPGRA